MLANLDGSKSVFYKEVEYVSDYKPCITIDADFKSFFQKGTSFDDIFFKKDNSWECEQEFRIVTDSEIEHEEFDVTGSIIAIIMCYTEDSGRHESCFGSDAYRKLKSQFHDYPILEWSNAECGCNLRDADGNQWYPQHGTFI